MLAFCHNGTSLVPRKRMVYLTRSNNINSTSMKYCKTGKFLSSVPDVIFCGAYSSRNFGLIINSHRLFQNINDGISKMNEDINGNNQDLSCYHNLLMSNYCVEELEETLSTDSGYSTNISNPQSIVSLEKESELHDTSLENDLLKRCHQCREIIILAKEKQEGEARKNADVLLEQIEQEEEERANKQAMQAKKREKKRLKKKAKQEKERQEKLTEASTDPKKTNEKNKFLKKEEHFTEANNNDVDSDNDEVQCEEEETIVADHVSEPETISVLSCNDSNNNHDKKKFSQPIVVKESIEQPPEILNTQSPSKDKIITDAKRDKHRNKKHNQRAAKRAEKQTKSVQDEPEVLHDSQESKSGSVCGTLDKDILYDLAVAESDEDQDWNAYIENKCAKYGQAPAKSPNEGAWKVVRMQKNHQSTNSHGHTTSGQTESVSEKKNFQSCTNSSKKRLSIPVSRHDIGKVIGQGGSVVSALRAMSGIQIDIESARGEEVIERKVYLKGPGEVVNNVHEIIQNLLTGNVAGNDVLVRYANCKKSGRSLPPASLTVASLLNASSSSPASTATIPSSVIKQPLVASTVKKQSVVPLMNTCKLGPKSGQIFTYTSNGKHLQTSQKVNFAAVAASGVVPDSHQSVNLKKNAAVVTGSTIVSTVQMPISMFSSSSNVTNSNQNLTACIGSQFNKVEVGIHDPSIFPPLTTNCADINSSTSLTANNLARQTILQSTTQSSSTTTVVSSTMPLTQPLMLDLGSGQENMILTSSTRISSSIVDTMSSGIPSAGTSSQTSTVFAMNTTPSGTKSFARAPGSERSQHRSATSSSMQPIPISTFRDSAEVTGEKIHNNDLLSVSNLSSIMTPTKRVTQQSQHATSDFIHNDNCPNVETDALNDGWKQTSLLNNHNDDNHVSQLNNNANATGIDFTYDMNGVKSHSSVGPAASMMLSSGNSSNVRQQLFNTALPTQQTHIPDLPNSASFGHKSTFDFIYQNDKNLITGSANTPINNNMVSNTTANRLSMSRSYQQTQPPSRVPPSNPIFSQNVNEGSASMLNNQPLHPNLVPPLLQHAPPQHLSTQGSQMGLSHVNTQVPPPAFHGPAITMPPPHYESTIYGGIHSSGFSNQGNMIPPNPLLNSGSNAHLSSINSSSASISTPPVPIGAERRRQGLNTVVTSENSIMNGPMGTMHQQNGGHLSAVGLNNCTQGLASPSNGANSFMMSLNNNMHHKKSQPQWWTTGLTSGGKPQKPFVNNANTALATANNTNSFFQTNPIPPVSGSNTASGFMHHNQQHLWSTTGNQASNAGSISRQTASPQKWNGPVPTPMQLPLPGVLPPNVLHQLHNPNVPPPPLDHNPFHPGVGSTNVMHQSSGIGGNGSPNRQE